MGTNERVRRILELGQALIDSRHGVVIEQYAKKRGHSRSALYRDIGVLKALSFPIRTERGRHWLPADVRMFRRQGLDLDELQQLGLARELAGRLPGTRFDRGLASLWAKASETAGQTAMPLPPGGTLSVAAFDAIDYAPHRAVIDCLEDAVHRRIAVNLHHHKPGTELTHRVVEPGELHADATVGGMFLIAYCRWRREVRQFAIQRIVSVEQTGEKFTPRPEACARVAMRHAFGAWGGTQRSPTVVRLRFAAALADEIAERRQHPSQVVHRLDTGELVLELAVADPTSMIRWIMGFGAGVVVEEPAELEAEIRDRHRKAAGLGPADRLLRRQRGRVQERPKAMGS